MTHDDDLIRPLPARTDRAELARFFVDESNRLFAIAKSHAAFVVRAAVRDAVRADERCAAAVYLPLARAAFEATFVGMHIEDLHAELQDVVHEADLDRLRALYLTLAKKAEESWATHGGPLAFVKAKEKTP